MQHKAALGLYRPTEKHRRGAQVFAKQRQINLLKQAAQVNVTGFVDHQAKRSTRAVFAQIDHTFGKHRIL